MCNNLHSLLTFMTFSLSHICKGQDIFLVCPAMWTAGQTAVLNCVVKKSQWQPGVCSFRYSRAVTFLFQAHGQQEASATWTPQCTVRDVDKDCTGQRNSEGCGCKASGMEYHVFHHVNASYDVHHLGAWMCQPDCLGSGPDVLASFQSRACLYTHFEKNCDDNPCAPGQCSVQNNNVTCSCLGTYNTGPLCKDDPCASKPSGSCCVQRVEGGEARISPVFGYTDKYEQCDPVSFQESCKDLVAGYLVGMGVPAAIIGPCLTILILRKLRS